MPGSLAVPNIFLGNSPDPITTLDDNFAAVADYVNVRELTFGLFATRPAAGTAGRWFYATDTMALYADNGSNWIQVAAPLSGLITAAGVLEASGNDVDYATTSATFVDVDPTNLKVTVAVPAGAKFIRVSAVFSVLNSLINDGQPRVQFFVAGASAGAVVYCNNSLVNPAGVY